MKTQISSTMKLVWWFTMPCISKRLIIVLCFWIARPISILTWHISSEIKYGTKTVPKEQQKWGELKRSNARKAILELNQKVKLILKDGVGTPSYVQICLWMKLLKHSEIAPQRTQNDSNLQSSDATTQSNDNSKDHPANQIPSSTATSKISALSSGAFSKT